MIRNRSHIPSYVTKDGSTIRELFHPDSSPVTGFSVAEALVGPGEETKAHAHRRSQEIYYILEGAGDVRLGEETMAVAPGDAILILPEKQHMLKNRGPGALRILCISCPAYAHEETELEKALP